MMTGVELKQHLGLLLKVLAILLAAAATYLFYGWRMTAVFLLLMGMAAIFEWKRR